MGDVQHPGLTVFDGLVLSGGVNTRDAQLAGNIASSVRRGHPQVWPQPLQGERVALVGSGPSLALPEVQDTLVRLYFEGVKVVTLNAAYHWCRERNIRPSATVVLDARPSTARFVVPEVPRCRYFVASQCDPAVWDAVAGYAHVGIWHAVATEENPFASILDAYYDRVWAPVGGGTTVLTRALSLLRTMGWVRFDLFGCDSCWLSGAHHALPQPENAGDTRLKLSVHPSDRPDLARVFEVAPWMAKQAEDFLQMVRFHGDRFDLTVHGPGLLAYLLEASATGDDVTVATEQETEGQG